MAGLMDFIALLGNGGQFGQQMGQTPPIVPNYPQQQPAQQGPQTPPITPQNPTDQDKLAAFVGNLKRLGDEDLQRRQQEHIAKVFAANPDFAAKLYGTMGKLNGKDGSTPAAVQLANEIQKARKSGDTQRLGDLLLASKSLDKGVTYDANGNPVAMSGYADALGALGYGKKYGETRGVKDVEVIMDPVIASGTARATKTGAAQGDADALLLEMEAQMPNLQNVANKLSDLGQKATYTVAGQARDTIKRQTGQSVGEAGNARAEYISTIDNEVLPLLRQTFGAAFTQKEGETLRATLGDANKSPSEKDAALRAFINQKKEQVNSLRRQTGRNPANMTADDVLANDVLITGGNINPPSLPGQAVNFTDYFK